MMKKIFIYNIFILLFVSLFFGCQDTMIDDVDVDFNIEVTENQTGYIGKPIPISAEIMKVDERNHYPIQVKISSKKGKITASEGDSTRILKDVFITLDKNQEFYKLNYTPTEQGEDDLVLVFKNTLVEKTANVTISVKDALYSVIAENQPERPLIDSRFDFDLLIKEAEATGADSILTYAKVLKGEGSVYNGEVQLNGDTEASKSRFVVGRNKVSYLSKEEGENVIRFFFINKWGNEVYKDVSTNIFLPLWNIENSESDTLVVPYNEKKSFTIDIKEADIFEHNSYTASYRLLSNTQKYKLNINSKDVEAGSEFTLKAGSNVALLTLQENEKNGIIEIIAKDKYKQEHKDTLYFSTKMPVKPIEASLDKNSQSVKINQAAIFKLSLKEPNYEGVFSVKYEIVSGEGSFEGGKEHSLAEGTHNIKFTPTKQGSNTFKIIISDTNNQEKVINATVQATVSKLVASLSETNVDVVQGQTKTLNLNISEEDYTGKYFFSYTATGEQTLKIKGTNIGVGGTAEFTENQIPIEIVGTKLNSTSFTLSIKDEYEQTQTLTLKTSVKADVKVKAAEGGTATGSGLYAKGQKVTAKATAKATFGFDGWYKGTSKISSDNPYTFEPTESLELEARFAHNKINITTQVEKGGKAEGGGTYNEGTSVSLKATPDANYSFDGWYEGNNQVSKANPYTFTASKDRSIIAKFKGNSFNVTVNAEAGGKVTGSGSYEYGTKAKVSATVEANYSFAGWYIDDKLVSNSLVYEFTVTKNTTLEARFKAGKFNVTVNADAGGTATGSGSFDYNSNVTVKATPDANHTFGGWYKATTKVSSSAEYTFVLKEATTLEAKFTPKKYQLTVNAQTGGTATGSGSYDYGTKAKITAKPNVGHGFIGWYVGSTKVSSSTEYDILIEKATTVEARFAANMYVVNGIALVGGKVDGSGTYNHGETVTLKAIAEANYHFVGWYDDDDKQVSTAITYSFTVEGYTSLIAKFKGNPFNVTANAGTGGKATGSGTYDYGAKAKVSATADANYSFAGWYEGEKQISTSAIYEFTVTNNTTLEARFKAAKLNVTVNADAGGTATGSGSFDYNSNVTVKATPDANHTFGGWYKATTKVSSSAEYTFVLKEATTLEAKFTPKKYQLTVNAQTGGTATGSGSFEYGTKTKVKATANTGYGFAGWYIGSTKVSSSIEYEILIDKAITIEAKFTANKFAIGAITMEGGKVDGSGTYDYGTSVTVKAIADANYTFVAWYEDDKQVSSSAEYTFKVERDRLLEAKFKGNTFNVTVNAQTGGTATGSGSFEYNTKAKVSATAKANYSFSGWYEGEKLVSTSAIYEFTVTKNTTLEARFKAAKFNVTVNAEAGGTTSGSGSFDYNSNVTIKATPDANHTFSGWYKGATLISSSAEYTFVLKEAITLTAKFTAKKYKVTVNAGTGGTATGSGSFEFDSKVIVKATPDANHSFSGWYNGSQLVSNSAIYEFTLQKETVLEARFTAKKYSVTVNAGTGGTATGSGSFDYNSNVTIKATPDANHSFSGWYKGTTQVSPSAEYTFVLKEATTLEAKFTPKKYQLTVNTEKGGTVTGSGSYSYGTKAKVKATPNTGYSFSGWYISGTKVSSSTEYEILIDKAITIEAKFTAQKHTITVQAQTGGKTTGSGTYDYGTSVKLVATADANYSFVGWYEGETKLSSTIEYTITVTKDRTIQARFKGNLFNVTANAGTGGKATGSGSFEYNSKAKVTATADANYSFTGWYEGNNQVSNSAIYEFTVTKNIVLEARFKAAKFNVTVNALEGGTATGSGSFDYNSNVTVKATVNTGYKFAGWYEGENQVSTSLEYTFVLKKAITLQARFTANNHKIVVNAGTGGTATGSGTYKYGELVTLKAMPSTGYSFDGWYSGGTKISSTLTYSFNIEKDMNIEAKFTPNTFNIVVNAGTGGTATGSGSFKYGTTTTIKATSNTGYDFDGWYQNEKLVSSDISYTFTVKEALTLNAKFKLKKYKVTLFGTGGSQSGAGDYEYGSTATVKATPSAGYVFKGWYEDKTEISKTASYTFKVEKDRVLEAKYEQVKYNITLKIGEGGNASGGGTYTHDSKVTLIAVPDAGYEFLGWFEDGQNISMNRTYSFNIQSSRILEAKFKGTLFNYRIEVDDPTISSVEGSGGSALMGQEVSVKANKIYVSGKEALYDSNYAFIGWYDKDTNTKVSTDLTYRFIITKETNLVARFGRRLDLSIENLSTGVYDADRVEHCGDYKFLYIVNKGKNINFNLRFGYNFYDGSLGGLFNKHYYNPNETVSIRYQIIYTLQSSCSGAKSEVKGKNGMITYNPSNPIINFNITTEFDNISRIEIRLDENDLKKYNETPAGVGYMYQIAKTINVPAKYY